MSYSVIWLLHQLWGQLFEDWDLISLCTSAVLWDALTDSPSSLRVQMRQTAQLSSACVVKETASVELHTQRQEAVKQRR